MLKRPYNVPSHITTPAGDVLRFNGYTCPDYTSTRETSLQTRFDVCRFDSGDGWRYFLNGKECTKGELFE